MRGSSWHEVPHFVALHAGYLLLGDLKPFLGTRDFAELIYHHIISIKKFINS